MWSDVPQERHQHEDKDTVEAAAVEAVPKTEKEVGLQRRIEYFKEELKCYQHDLVDPKILREINVSLSSSYDEVLEYYTDKAALGAYTMEKELHRMSYSVTLPDGKKTTDHDEIKAGFEDNKDAMVWRLTNQSLFAQLIIALQTRLLRADLSIAIVNETSRFEVDLTEGHIGIEAVSVFKINTLGSDCEMLELGRIEGRVEIDLSARRLSQAFETPQLIVVLDEKWHGAAATLALSSDPFDEELPYKKSAGSDSVASLKGLVQGLGGAAGSLAEDAKEGGAAIVSGLIGTATGISSIIGAGASTSEAQDVSQADPLPSNSFSEAEIAPATAHVGAGFSGWLGSVSAAAVSKLAGAAPAGPGPPRFYNR